MNPRREIPPGRQPYDVYNGMRVGGLSGLLIGGGLSIVTGWFWLILVGGLGGAIAGYLWERREFGRDLAAANDETDTPAE